MVVLVLGDFFWYGVGSVIICVFDFSEWCVLSGSGMFFLVVVWLGWFLEIMLSFGLYVVFFV